jgi:hypothetical protein
MINGLLNARPDSCTAFPRTRFYTCSAQRGKRKLSSEGKIESRAAFLSDTRDKRMGYSFTL